MSEETTQETVVAEPIEEPLAPVEEEAAEPESPAPVAEEETPSDRPDPVRFAGFLFGGWLAVMIVFVLIAAIAMVIVG